MEKLILNVPLMFADHHVLKVRDVLSGLEGVGDIYASSAWKQVMIAYDPGKLEPAAIEKSLAEAGYPPGEGETPVLVERSAIKRDPQWERLAARSTQTYQADIDMSGEFRRY